LLPTKPSAGEALVVTLDVGTSSVRTLLFDAQGRQQDGFGEQIHYEITATPDGGVEISADQLLDLSTRCLAKIHEQMAAASLRPEAVSMCTFWHSFLGVDRQGRPTTPILHLFDTRSTEQVKQLERKLDPRVVHARTGCRLHTSYWPAKLLWLHQNRADAFEATDRWISFGEFLFLRLFGAAIASTSMVSGSGLWNEAKNDYDEPVLSVLPVDRFHLAPWGEMDMAQTRLLEPYRSSWPAFDAIPWFPAWGDGACNNVGSGCITRDIFSLMVGTSGAMRSVVEAEAVEIPEGLWCYRVDRSRYVLGGALSNGGEVYAWMQRVLALPDAQTVERQLAGMQPGSHGLLLLPFFAGERSPYWRADLRAAVTGLNLSTQAIDILRAALESVALRFREIFDLMSSSLGRPKTVIASGGALLHSPAWTQMMADALGVTIVTCIEAEATSRGAALLALERIGALHDLASVGIREGPCHASRAGHNKIYAGLLDEQRGLYNRLFSEN
jgi:gluconokinase